MGQVDL